MKYLVFYKDEYSAHRVLYSDTNKFATLSFLPLTAEYHCFELFKGYDATDDGLKQFMSDFNMWADEILTNDILNIDYRKYHKHFFATELTFKRLCKGKYEHMEPISGLEAKWMKACNNGGLMYCKELDEPINSYGYDYTSCYPHILGSFKFKFPIREGNEYTLTQLPDKLMEGFYRVKIVGSNFLFAFSRNDVYTKTSIEQAMDLDLDIELICDDKPNAYLYDNKDVTSGNKVFGTWMDKLFKLKMKFPKNKLIKHLLSSLWGTLTRRNMISRTYEQVMEEKLDITFDKNNMNAQYLIEDIKYNSKDEEFYKLLNNFNPYKHNIRLLPFLTSFARKKIAGFVDESNISNVLRIQTDNIVFDKPMKFDDPLFKAESKTTGLIQWNNVNDYVKH